jgi:hypothetical protein
MPQMRPGPPAQPIPTWRGQRVNAHAATPAAIGNNAVNTTIAGALTAGAAVVITPASMANITVGKWVSIVKSSTQEYAQVLAVTSTTFTANLVNSYGAASNLYSVDGAWIYGFLVGTAPATSADTLTFFNGLSGMLPRAGAQLSAIVIPTTQAIGFIPFPVELDQGAFFTLTGSGTVGDYTILFLDHPPRVQ